MDKEKDLLKQDLGNQEKPEEIKKFIEDAELLGHEDIAELGRTKLQEILEKANSVEKTSESQIAQVGELGGSNEVLESKTQEVDKKIEEVQAEATEKIKEVEKAPIVEVNTEGGKEINNEKTEEEIISPEDQKKLDKEKQINNKIFDRKEDIAMFKEKLNTITFRLEENEKSKELLNEYLNKLVRKSSLSSEIAGNSWELVEETQKLRQIELQQKARMAQLKQNGKTWEESRSDSEIRDMEKQMDSLVTEDISQKFGYSNPGEGIIYLKGPCGEIGKEGVMTLKDALDNSIKYHKELISEYENLILKNEKDIENLKEEQVVKTEKQNESEIPNTSNG